MSEKINVRRSWIIIVLAIALVLPLFAGIRSASAAAEGNFDLTVYHGIKGDELGLSRELPVNIWVYRDGYQFAKLSGFEFRERINLELPAGNYKIMIESVELGVVIDSMTLGPVDIPEGANLAIRASLATGQIPVLTVRGR